MRAKYYDTFRVRLYNENGKEVFVITDNGFTRISEMIGQTIHRYGKPVNNKYQVEIICLDTEKHGWYSIKGRKIN